MIFQITPRQAYAIASNIRDGENPPYTVSDFRAAMPAFTNAVIPDTALAGYIEMANSVVKEVRWHGLWKEGMRLFIAHFVSLYLQTPDTPTTREAIINASRVGGGLSSKSVGPISVSYDNSMATSALTDWAAWNLTTYGVQFATLAKLLGKGGMLVR